MRIRPMMCCVLAAGALIATPAGATPRPDAYVLPGAAVFPEGIAFQRETGHFFVSSTSDGSILRGHVSEPAASPFIPGTTGQFSAIGLELDRAARLYVAGGATGSARVYDAASGALVGSHASPAGGFMNDVAVARTGDAFVTDSFRPILWRIPAGESETSGALEPWLSYAGTPIQYTSAPDDFEINGIAASESGRYLVVVQSNTGELFRIEIATRRVVEIDLGGASVNGDGLELVGRRLYAVADGAIVEILLSGDLTRGDVVSRTSDPSFDSPTTNAIARGRMLVVNSQFERLFGGQPPVLPFTVSSIPLP
jgi:DNA-binding beta-propeller fold protein YncE